MAITIPSMANLTSSLDVVSIEDVKNVSPNQFLTGILYFGKFGEWCQQCLAAIEEQETASQFADMMVKTVIESYTAVQDFWDTDLTICAKLLRARLQNLPNVEKNLQRILNSTDVIKEFNMDIFVRTILINIIKDPKKYRDKSGQLEKENSSQKINVSDSPNADDLPPKKKKKMSGSLDNISSTASGNTASQKIKIKVPTTSSNTITHSRIGEIVAAFVLGKSRKTMKVFQVRLTKLLDGGNVRTVDPWPADPNNPGKWDLSVDSVVDYKGFTYSKNDFKVGDFVYALFCLDLATAEMSSEFYPGRVAEISDSDITIQFEDSDNQAVKYDQLFKMSDVKNQEIVRPPKFE